MTPLYIITGLIALALLVHLVLGAVKARMVRLIRQIMEQFL